MHLRNLLLATLSGVALGISFAVAQPSAPSQLFNPDFEQDTDNVGFPDGWSVAKNAKITLERENVSTGTRALVIEDGYAAVSQNLNIENLAGRRVALSLDARSPDGASLGVRIGYFIKDAQGKKKWVDSAMIWNRKLTPEFQTYRATRVMAEDALDGRFWFCLYRSKKEGIVVVDNISLELLDPISSLSPKQSVVLQRERGYLQSKLSQAEARTPANPSWAQLRAQISALWEAAQTETDGNKAFADTLQAFSALNAELMAAAYPDRSFTADWKDAYARLDLNNLPVQGADSWSLTALADETVGLGVEIANTTTAPQRLLLTLEGTAADAVQTQMRRQIPMETFYTKGETLVADPLTLLPAVGEKWELNLEPGETTRVFVGMKVKPVEGDAVLAGTLKVESQSSQQVLPFELNVFAAAAPTTPQLAHYQFQYTNMNVMHSATELARDNLEAYGVTDIEWAFKPSATFSPEGKLEKVSWGAHERWLKGFKDSDIRLNLFWLKDLKRTDGENLEMLSPQWTRAWQELVSAYLDYAESLGIPRERFTILPMDEIHSRRLEDSPDDKITDYVAIAKATREKEPELPQYLTVGNYAFPADIALAEPTLDVAIVHWPRPERLTRNAPADYEARKEFLAKTLPILEKARSERGMKLWSYHVQSGKNSDVLRFSRAYPLLSTAAGYTGFGYWAWNVMMGGTTWDDTDGKLLDYVLIYDGREQHPLNIKYNVTKEVVVPSIRWEAIRASQQDGQILLYLMDFAQKDECPESIRLQIDQLLADIRVLGGEFGEGGDSLSLAAMKDVSERLRAIYAKVPQK